MNHNLLLKNQLAQKCVSTMLRDDYCSQYLEILVEDIRHDQVVVSMKIKKYMLNGFGSCHGGIIFSLADSTFAFASNVHNEVTIAAGCDINYVKPAQLGDQLTAISQCINHKGRLGIYDISIANQRDELVAAFRGRAYTIKGKTILS